MNIPDSVKKAIEEKYPIDESGITKSINISVNAMADALREAAKDGYSLAPQSNAGVWVNLREKFFKECVDNKDYLEHGLPQSRLVINMHPHNVFEWFKASITLDESPSSSKPNAGVSEEALREFAMTCWKSGANAYRLYPDQKHSFADVSEYLMGEAKKLSASKPKDNELLEALPPVPVKDFGTCTAKGCNKPAIGDYNGHGDFACVYHMIKWENEFDEDYK
jgi:hypothetical protein